MGTRRNPGRFDGSAMALDDEPQFTLLARDPSAPSRVLQWAYEREREILRGDRPRSDLEMVDEARRVAKQMVAWRIENDGAWRKGVSSGPSDPYVVICPACGHWWLTPVANCPADGTSLWGCKVLRYSSIVKSAR